MIRVGIDVGVGHVKVVSDIGELKFPTMLAYFMNTGFNETETIEYKGQKYTIGEDARYERNKISISSTADIIKYYPIFQEYVLKKLGLKREHTVIVTGVPPNQKSKKDQLKAYCDFVLPQGLGIYIDVQEKITGRSALILDVGYNTVDYILVANGEKKKGETFEKQGVERIIELFRNHLPNESEELSKVRQFPFHKLMECFLDGSAQVQGKKIDLASYKDRAIQDYNTMLLSRLYEEIDYLLDEVEQIILAGGGAYYIKNLRSYGVIVPDKPEMAQARGYMKSISKEEDEYEQINITREEVSV